ncbi:Protein YzbB, partial [hydrothermal vent metagenome]
MRLRILLFVLFLFSGWVSRAQNQPPVLTNYNQIVTGDEQTSAYFPLLRGKRVAVVANQSSIIGKTHLVDSLLSSGIRVVRIFSPEHGFRGNKSAGTAVKNGLDTATGLPVISLYGKHKKPTVEDLQNVDVVLFDLQDVGVRFYTYISTMTLVMEACAENKVPLIILDRPNPNGFYVDGPVLKPGFTSFVGMHPVPVVYGMTLGEY